MWNQIVGTLVFLIVATYLVQLFVPRARGNANQRRTNAKWDIAPIVGFFAVLVLVLSFTEALRRSVIDSWAWGLALGLVIGIIFWVGSANLPSIPAQRPGSALIATYRFLRAYGIYILFGIIGTYVAVRVIGAVVEVFIAGAASVLMFAIALRMFFGTKPITRERG